MDETYTDEQRYALHRLSMATRDLHRYLQDAVSTAERAMEALEMGGAVVGAQTFGPLGHQLPFDLARATTKVDAALELCTILGINSDAITEAYKVKAA